MQPDEFSKKIAEQLFELHPEWWGFARWVQDAEEQHTHLYIEVPSPESADLKHPLYVTTEDSEVTVGVDYYHSHFSELMEPLRDSDSPDALNFIEGLLSETICICSWWADNLWRGSSQCPAGKKPEPIGIREEFNRIRIRSWKGTYDQDISLR